MKLETDVLVIGGGMAGLTAACTAAEAGASITVVRKGHGATADSSGAIDIAGYLPGGSTPFGSAREGLQALVGLFPYHPYSVLGRVAADAESQFDQVLERVTDSVSSLKRWLSGSPAEVMGSLDHNISAVTVLGSTKPTSLLQTTMTPPEWDDDSTLLFAGFRGHSDFNASLAAKTFMAAQARLGEPPRRIADAQLSLAPFGKPYNVSSIEIARHLDHPGGIDALAEELSGHVERIGATHIALPPVLGLKRPAKNRSLLEELIEAQIFELLSFPPSVPGLRLLRSLDAALIGFGGRILEAHEAVGYEKSGSEISRIKCTTHHRTLEMLPSSVVIAGGKFIGGGIIGTEDGLTEPLFGLPVVSEDWTSTAGIRPQRLTRPVSITSEGHGLFACGLAVDKLLRPLDESGDTFANNLFSAGGMMAGYNYPVEKSGLGVALATGVTAGMNAVERVQEGRI
ncbi:anaerobic glycerol-3-phosphate dehydrogenase subunit B [Candidatus Thorarchaeota archaeon]|nr:MAG: anaerobic glycerol-3-phosphate dehydrogenase subunit B [Candidatus Thorarchaeota archaeon]